MPRDYLKLHSSPSLALAGVCRIPQSNVITRRAESSPSIVVPEWDIDRGNRGPSGTRYLRHFPYRHQERHLPSDVPPIRERNYTTDDP